MRHQHAHGDMAKLCNNGEPSAGFCWDNIRGNDRVLPVLAAAVSVHADPNASTAVDVLGKVGAGLADCTCDGRMDLGEGR